VAQRAAQLRKEFEERGQKPKPHSPQAKKLGATGNMHHLNVVVEDLSFESERGVEVPVRVFKGNPNADVATGPVLVYFHGDGYVLGDLESHDWICRSLAALASVSVVAVGYRQPPEDPFPAAFEDAYRAVCWVSSGGLGKVPDSVCVGGDSAGGGLALACCLKARDEESGPDIDLQVLFYPWLDLRPDGPTMQNPKMTAKDIPVLADFDWFREVYAPPHQDTGSEEEEGGDAADAAVAQHPLVEGRPWFEDLRASPLLAPSLAELPAAFIAYAADDPLSGEAILLAERLAKEVGHEGVHTLHLDGPLGHGFARRQGESQAHTALSAAAAFLSAALRAPTSPALEKSLTRRGFGRMSSDSVGGFGRSTMNEFATGGLDVDPPDAPMRSTA